MLIVIAAIYLPLLQLTHQAETQQIHFKLNHKNKKIKNGVHDVFKY